MGPEGGCASFKALRLEYRYDVEADISSVLGTAFELPTKNQGDSGSCGGQAFSYYGQALAAYYPHSIIERSAKYPYSQVYVAGGGSSDRDLAQIAIRQGFAPESLCASYQDGQPPTEAFMERPQDITARARIAAAGEKIVSAHAFPQSTLIRSPKPLPPVKVRCSAYLPATMERGSM